METLMTESMDKVKIKAIDAERAKELCKELTASLPEWFGIPEANERYQHAMLKKTSFAAFVDNTEVGMITLELPFANNGLIYWMAVKPEFHGKGIGKKLLQAAEDYCISKGCFSLTVETLSPKQNNDNYFRTYRFYEKCGFKPLFEMHTYDNDNLMVYLQKIISLAEFDFIDLTHSLSSDVPHWGVDVGFKYNARLIESPDSSGRVKFRVQRLEMSSGIGTHMDAPSHCFEGAPSIDEIPLRNLITRCCVINVSNKVDAEYAVSVDDILQFENKFGMIQKNSFVIVYTGWGERWTKPDSYRNEKVFPSISLQAAQLLLERSIVGLGIDTLSPDVFGSDFPVHELLLGAGKYIIENVANANQLHPSGDFVFALPIKVHGGTEAPMRLIGMKRKE